jgi:hypothetical protein
MVFAACPSVVDEILLGWDSKLISRAKYSLAAGSDRCNGAVPRRMTANVAHVRFGSIADIGQLTNHLIGVLLAAAALHERS